MTEKDQLLDDLQYMKKIINESRNIVIRRGSEFIVWGTLIVTGLLYTYLDIIMRGSLRNDAAWIILVSGGWAYSLWRWYKDKDHKKVSTFSGRLLGMVWLSSGITLTVLGFIGPLAKAYSSVFISPIIATVLGTAFLVSSLIYNNTLMMKIAPLWWFGAVYMFFFPNKESLLIMALMMLFLQVLPGVILQKKYKTEVEVNAQ